MKKSEAIKKMVDIAKHHDGGYLEPYVADKILEYLEQAGMLPPYNNDHGFSNYDIAMGVSTESLHKWEPEDELS
jgi:hypothetical protein